ncbi:hypothetical protein ACFX2K_031593 [Malus domestica]
MWQLGLTSSESYPERPGVPNCVYYMRTGFCGYGGRCRYNHPRDRAAVVAVVRATGDYPERVGEPICQYYLKTGTCKFGASCKFHHPKHGYPLRPGENECSYYLKTGQYKFGITCKFHHPQPAGTTIPASAPQFYPSLFRFRVGVRIRPVLSPGAQPTVGATSLYGITQLSSPTHGLASPYTSITSSVGPSSSNPSGQVFPERPGELECQYYLKTGDCKHGSSCRYHHPRD